MVLFVAPRPLSARSGSPAAILFFTGAVHGYVDVCGCPTAPLGSLSRRAAQMRATQRRAGGAASIALDAGNFSADPGPAGEVRTRGLLEAMGELGYRAAGVGERDLAHGPDRLLEFASALPFPLLSSNVVRETDHAPWLPPSQLVDAGGMRIGLVAAMHHNPLTSWTLKSGLRLVTIDPVATVARAVADLRGRSDLVVLLAAMPIEDARLVARQVPGIDLVIGGHGGRVTNPPLVEGQSRIVFLEDEGKYLGEALVFAGKGGGHPTLDVRSIQLGEQVGTDPRWESFTIETMARAQEAEDGELSAATGAPAAATYLGNGACAACHFAVVDQWSRTAHARAWRTLSREPGRRQASCIPCHVTGHGAPGGFVGERETPHLLNVGCEACHGPASAHVADAAPGYGRTGLATCTACHNAEMDPGFNYLQDLQRVLHGEATTR